MELLRDVLVGFVGGAGSTMIYLSIKVVVVRGNRRRRHES